MPGRPYPLVTGEYYHIYNRGVALAPTFFGIKDYKQGLLDLAYYKFATPPVKLSILKRLSTEQRTYLLNELSAKNHKLVDIISFSFMPNHFHLLLKQEVDRGIATFMSRFTNSLTKFVNTRIDRTGPLYQGAFKSVHIDSDEQLIHVSRYIHINPTVSSLVEPNKLEFYPWTSLPEFLHTPQIVNPLPILSFFPSPEAYRKFVFDQIDYGKKLEQIKHLLLE